MFAPEAKTRHTNQRVIHTNTKKRGDWLLPVPRIEALRLPCNQERATIDPTPICMAHPYDDRGVCIYTYPWASTAAMFNDCNLKFLRFLCVKNKASSKRLYYFSESHLPNPSASGPAALLPGASAWPSLRPHYGNPATKIAFFAIHAKKQYIFFYILLKFTLYQLSPDTIICVFVLSVFR